MAPELPANRLILYIQPGEGVDLQFNMKKPGETDEIVKARMDFCQNSTGSSQSNTPKPTSVCLPPASWWDQIEVGGALWSGLGRLRRGFRSGNILPACPARTRRLHILNGLNTVGVRSDRTPFSVHRTHRQERGCVEILIKLWYSVHEFQN